MSRWRRYDQTRLCEKVPSTNLKHEWWLLEWGFAELANRLWVNIPKESIIVLFTWGIDSTTILKAALDGKRSKWNCGNIYPLQVLRKNMPSIELGAVDKICAALDISVERLNYPEGQPETYMNYMNLAHKFASQVWATKILVWHVLTDRYTFNSSFIGPLNNESLNNSSFIEPLNNESLNNSSFIGPLNNESLNNESLNNESLDFWSSLRENRFFRKIRVTTWSHVAKVVSPFWYVRKSVVIEYAKKIGVPLEMTVSCPYYIDDVWPCGKCPQCLDRQSILSFTSMYDTAL